MARPGFSWGDCLLVAAGGAIGVGLRALLLLPESDGWAVWGVPTLNLIGALLLGLVTGWAARIGSSARARVVRLLVGTGAMGGFTTYSSFAVNAVHGEALWITLATAVVGVGAAWAGLVLSRPRLLEVERVGETVDDDIDDRPGEGRA